MPNFNSSPNLREWAATSKRPHVTRRTFPRHHLISKRQARKPGQSSRTLIQPSVISFDIDIAFRQRTQTTAIMAGDTSLDGLTMQLVAKAYSQPVALKELQELVSKLPAVISNERLEAQSARFEREINLVKSFHANRQASTAVPYNGTPQQSSAYINIPQSTNAAKDAEIQTLRTQCDNSKAEIRKLRAQFEASEAGREIHKLRSINGSLHRDVNVGQKETQRLMSVNTSLKGDVRALRKELDGLKATTTGRLVSNGEVAPNGSAIVQQGAVKEGNQRRIERALYKRPAEATTDADSSTVHAMTGQQQQLTRLQDFLKTLEQTPVVNLQSRLTGSKSSATRDPRLGLASYAAIGRSLPSAQGPKVPGQDAVPDALHSESSIDSHLPPQRGPLRHEHAPNSSHKQRSNSGNTDGSTTKKIESESTDTQTPIAGNKRSASEELDGGLAKRGRVQKSEDYSCLVGVRKPICLQCRDSILECNGKSPCSNCDPDNRTCIYMPCPRGDACALDECGYTHDGNVSVFNEPGRHVLGSSAALMPTPEAQQSEAAPVGAAQIEARRLLVVGLAYETTERDLKDFFKDFNIDYINFAWKGLTGFAFVDVHTPGEAETAISQLNGGKLLGRKLKIELSSQPKLERCNDKEYDNAGMKGVGGGSAVMQQIPSHAASDEPCRHILRSSPDPYRAARPLSAPALTDRVKATGLSITNLPGETTAEHVRKYFHTLRYYIKRVTAVREGSFYFDVSTPAQAAAIIRSFNGVLIEDRWPMWIQIVGNDEHNLGNGHDAGEDTFPAVVDSTQASQQMPNSGYAEAVDQLILGVKAETQQLTEEEAQRVWPSTLLKYEGNDD
ncbi:hypothetical protein LTR37_004247 [Vermiconidia calcicola]|uniref:Uncharacterized protein n=1 Tax=Vermiconidia calcicola TaxID=1690605 RepID=A0ACC3NN55_9PEZI|nr:hypothetical protein LTR37_004247 [Vermiconidia calcicola]